MTDADDVHQTDSGAAIFCHRIGVHIADALRPGSFQDGGESVFAPCHCQPILRLICHVIAAAHGPLRDLRIFAGMLIGERFPASMYGCPYQDHLGVQPHSVALPELGGPLQRLSEISLQRVIDGLLHHPGSCHSLVRIKHAKAVLSKRPVNIALPFRDCRFRRFPVAIILRLTENRAGRDHLHGIHGINPIGNSVHEVPLTGSDCFFDGGDLRILFTYECFLSSPASIMNA